MKFLNYTQTNKFFVRMHRVRPKKNNIEERYGLIGELANI